MQRKSTEVLSELVTRIQERIDGLQSERGKLAKEADAYKVAGMWKEMGDHIHVMIGLNNKIDAMLEAMQMVMDIQPLNIPTRAQADRAVAKVLAEYLEDTDHYRSMPPCRLSALLPAIRTYLHNYGYEPGSVQGWKEADGFIFNAIKRHRRFREATLTDKQTNDWMIYFWRD